MIRGIYIDDAPYKLVMQHRSIDCQSIMIPKKLAEPPAHVEIYLDANAVFQLERLGVNQERDEEEYRWRFVYSKKPVKISRAYNTRTSVLTISLLAPLVEIASKFPRPVAGPISVLPY